MATKPGPFTPVEQMDGDPVTNNTANSTVTLLSSADRTATAASSDQTNKYFQGVRLYLDTTDFSTSTPSEVIITLQGKDPVTGNYVAVSGATVTGSATGTKMLTVHPAVAASANVAVAEPLPLTWRVIGTLAGTSSARVTYSVGAELIR